MKRVLIFLLVVTFLIIILPIFSAFFTYGPGSPVATGVLVGLAPKTMLQAPQIEI